MTQPAPGAPATGEPTAPPAGDPATPPATPPTTGQPGTSETDTTDWKTEAEKAKADADKWKALSRKNENDLRAEQAKAAKAGMTDAEKATADAEAKGRQAAAKEYGVKLAAAEFKAECATAKVDLGDALDLIDTSRFVKDDGDVDSDGIKKAVAKLAKQFAAKPGAGKSGGEFDGGTGAGTPITEEQMRKMTPAQRVEALEKGQLAHLL